MRVVALSAAVAFSNSDYVRCIFFGRGLLELGADDDEVLEFVNDRLAWSKLYTNSDDRQL